jgi:hypothetical protein
MSGSALLPRRWILGAVALGAMSMWSPGSKVTAGTTRCGPGAGRNRGC